MKGTLRRKIAILVNMDTKDINKNVALISRQLGKLRDVAKKVFKIMAVAATALAVAFGFIAKSIIQTGIQFEKFEIQLKVLFGSAAAGKKAFNWIKDFAKSTPFELEEIVAGFVRLKATGLNAAENNLLQDMGDLAAAAQKPLEQVVEAVSNIASGLTGIGIKQLRQLNISNQMLEKQGIQFNSQGRALANNFEIIKAMQRVVADQNFTGLMDAQAKTIGGILTNVLDAWTQIKGGIAEGIFPVIRPELEKLRDFLFGLVDDGSATAFGEKMGLQLRGVIRFLKKEIPALFNRLVSIWNDKVRPIFDFIWDNSLIKKAVIILIFSKVLSIAKEIALTMKAVGLLAGGGKLVGAITGRVAAAGAAATAGGVAAGGLLAGGVSAAITAALPVILGVLATAAVGFAIFKLIKGFESKEDKELKRAKKEFASVTAFDSGVGVPTRIQAAIELARAEKSVVEKGLKSELRGRFGRDAVPADQEKIKKLREEILALDNRIVMLAKTKKDFVLQTAKFEADAAAKTKKALEEAEKAKAAEDTESFQNERKIIQDQFIKIERARALLGLAGLAKKEKELELDNAIKINKIKGLESVKSTEIVRLVALQNKAYEEQLIILREMDALDIAKANRESVREAKLAGGEVLADIQAEIDSIKFENQLSGLTEFESEKRRIQRETFEFVQLLALDETLLISDKSDIIIRLKELEGKRIEALEKKQTKETKKNLNVRQLATLASFGALSKAGEQFARGEINLTNAVKVFAISAAGDTVAAILDQKKKEAEVKALLALGDLQFGRAALFFAAAAAAGTAATFVRSQTQDVIDRSVQLNENALSSVDSVTNDASSGGGTTRQGGIVTRGIENVFISPSVTFQGESIIIGDNGLIESAETIGRIAVGAVRDALDTGELSIGA